MDISTSINETLGQVIDAVAGDIIPNQLDRKTLYEVPDREGKVQIINPERYADTPRRTRGTVSHTTDESWLEYWTRQTGSSLDEIWADLDKRTVTAVFDAPTQDKPAWAEHRSVLNLKLSPQWLAWFGINDKPLAQTVFGEFLEDHPRDIVEPNSAEMLELVMDFEATANSQFNSSERLSDGSRKLNYTNEVNASGGKGNITIPSEVTVSIPVFLGGERIGVTARFRYRLNGGHLSLMIKIDDPDAVLQAAFDAVIARIGEGTNDHPIMYGSRPTTDRPDPIITAGR